MLLFHRDPRELCYQVLLFRRDPRELCCQISGAVRLYRQVAVSGSSILKGRSGFELTIDIKARNGQEENVSVKARGLKCHCSCLLLTKGHAPK